MKQPVHPRDPGDVEASEDARSRPHPHTEPRLSDTQKQVLEQLGLSARAMTVRQLETAIGCGVEELTEALEGLLRASLVSRLNTVIPSYVNRYPGIRIYGEQDPSR